MASLSNFQKKAVPLAVEIKGINDQGEEFVEVVNLVYRALKITKRNENEFREFMRRSKEFETDQEAGPVASVLVDHIKLTVISWDLKQDEGDLESILITDDGLIDVPVEILGTIVTAIFDDLRPNSTTGKSLPDTLDGVVTSVESPITTSSLEQQST